MLRTVIFLCGALVLAYGQYYPRPPSNQIGFLPIYLPNNTYNATRYNATPINNNYNSWGGCEPYGFDVTGSHSLFAGCVRKNDTLLFQQVVDKPSRFFSVREKTIDFPGSAVSQGHVVNRIITGVRCYDLKGRGKGGIARIIAGGVGQPYVRINLTSVERNRSLLFRVEIYGH